MATVSFKQIIASIRSAVLGSEVRESIAQMGECVEDFANAAAQNATAAQTSADAAQKSQTAAAASEKNAGASASAASKSEAAAQNAETAAKAAAKRAEELAPAEGQVLSVNGKGGTVQLDAQDVNAVEKGSNAYIAGVTIDGQTVTVRFGDGSSVSYTVDAYGKSTADEKFLPNAPATKSTLGGVKQGAHCTIAADGTLTPDTAYLDLSDDRPASANIDFSKPAYQGRLTYTLASSRMTTGKPTQGESYLLSLGWDANNAGSQIAVRTGQNPHLQIRGKGGSTSYGDWVTVVDSTNIQNYLSLTMQQITDMQVALCELYEEQEATNG